MSRFRYVPGRTSQRNLRFAKMGLAQRVQMPCPGLCTTRWPFLQCVKSLGRREASGVGDLASSGQRADPPRQPLPLPSDGNGPTLLPLSKCWRGGRGVRPAPSPRRNGGTTGGPALPLPILCIRSIHVNIPPLSFPHPRRYAPLTGIGSCKSLLEHRATARQGPTRIIMLVNHGGTATQPRAPGHDRPRAALRAARHGRLSAAPIATVALPAGKRRLRQEGLPHNPANPRTLTCSPAHRDTTYNHATHSQRLNHHSRPLNRHSRERRPLHNSPVR